MSEQMRFSPQTACIGLACFLAGASYDKLLLTQSQFDDSDVTGSALQPARRPSIPTVLTPMNNRRGHWSVCLGVLYRVNCCSMFFSLEQVMQFKRSANGEHPENQTLLILSPVRNRGSSHHTPIGHFVELVNHLTYPKHLTSVALLEGDSNDDTWELMQQSLARLHGYRTVEALKKDFGPMHGGGDGGGEGRHAVEVQLRRRQRLAQVRNWLLSVALRDHDYVLWLDSDLWEIPSDLVQLLMASGKDLVVPNCLVAGTDRTYDLNRFALASNLLDPFLNHFLPAVLVLGSWQETPESIQQLKDLPDDQPLFEGYGDHPTFRKHIGSLGSQGDVVKLDGIGGSAILAKGDLFRSKYWDSGDMARHVVKH